NPEEVVYTLTAQNVAGGELDANSLHSRSSWTDDGDVHVQTITFPGSANYTFNAAYTDLARLTAAEGATEYFTVDTIMPSGLTVSYSTSVLETILSAITFGFYDAKMTVTVVATDDIAGVYSFMYSYLNAEGVSAVNAQLEEDMLEMSSLVYSDDGATATGTFEISKQELAADNQFNGTVTFSATDRSGNVSDPMQDDTRIVVDNISPTADVQYNEPVQTLDNVAYYDGSISAAVTINEANFYSEDVTISVTKDGAAYGITPVWTDNNVDVHTGTFTLTEDGDYLVDITYTDKSGNVMQQYTSGQMTIDTDILEAVITINGADADGKAFKGDVVPAVSFTDTNFQDYEIRLTRTRYGNKDVDVTEQFITGHISTNATGGSGTFDTFEKVQDNDGIYTLTVVLNDKAAHTIEKSVTFTVNRYGSVYEYSDYLVSLIQNGGAYVQQIDEDLVITEYNADRLVDGSLNIEISRDGKPLEDSGYTVTPEMNRTVAAGSSGWYQYQYTIDRDNFNMDGVYKISVSSMDATGNAPENSNYEDKGILFRVDSTPPEIDSITGLEEPIINATSVDIKYSIYDTIGLMSVVSYVDGMERERITDFSEDMNHYSGSFTLAESTSEQRVRLVVTDLAGNVTDTSSDGFTSAYAFNSSVTVSTNALVRWFANRKLFWGSIAGGAGTAAAGTGMLVWLSRRRKAIKAAVK
ncbi:MAG: hypothetical protein NC121_19770, partial [Blautia sp.]|nr:hypothetical protein [Blautia sp.]